MGNGNNPELIKEEREQLVELGTDLSKTKNGNIYTLTIIGQVEGHQVLPETVKTTKYEHVLPLLAGIEEKGEAKSSMKSLALSMLVYSGRLKMFVMPSMYRLTFSMSSRVLMKLGITLPFS